MYLRKFMLEHGVRSKPVDGDILEAEFGADLLNKLQRKGYIMKRRNGFIMGI